MFVLNLRLICNVFSHENSKNEILQHIHKYNNHLLTKTKMELVEETWKEDDFISNSGYFEYDVFDPMDGFATACKNGKLKELMTIFQSALYNVSREKLQIHLKRGFLMACIYNHSKIIHWIKNTTPITCHNFRREITYGFYRACMNGSKSFTVIKLLYTMASEDVELIDNLLTTPFLKNQTAIIKVCMCGWVEGGDILDWINKTSPNTLINFVNNLRSDVINGICETNNLVLESIGYMCRAHTHIRNNLKAKLECVCFLTLCEKGAVDVLKFLHNYKVWHENQRYMDGHQGLEMACKLGKIETAKWLYGTYVNYLSSTERTNNLKQCWQVAKENKQHMVQAWLKEIYPTIDHVSLRMPKEKVFIEQAQLCAICHDIKSDVITECKHQFCKECMTNWWNRGDKQSISCPCCRTSVSYVRRLVETE